jgi:ATP-dependent exoDNAse (exonuclease V) beta subunit
MRDAVRKSERLLVRFRAHPLYEEMARAEQRIHEAPYHAETHEQVQSGILDALYRQGGRWTIVEFKTDELRDEADLERLMAEEDYLPQARRYGQAAEWLLGQKPRLALCLLNFAGGVCLHFPDEVEGRSTT